MPKLLITLNNNLRLKKRKLLLMFFKDCMLYALHEILILRPK